MTQRGIVILIIIVLIVTSTITHCEKLQRYKSACQRTWLYNGTVYLDIDYFYKWKHGLYELRIDASIPIKFIKNDKYWIAIGPTGSSQDSDFVYNGTINMRKFTFNTQEGFYWYADAIKPTNEVIVMGSTHRKYSDKLSPMENVDFIEELQLNPSDYYRVGCDGIDSFTILVRGPIYEHIAIIITMVLVIVLMVTGTCLVSNRVLSKRRKTSSIIGNLCVLVTAIVFAVHETTQQVFFAVTLVEIEDDHIGRWFYILFVIIPVVATEIAILAYFYRILRYLHIKYMYSSVLLRWRRTDDRLSRFLTSKWFCIVLFIIGTILTRGIAVVVTTIVFKFDKAQTFGGMYASRLYICIILVMTIVPLFLVGIFSLFKLRKGCIHYFVTDDPLLFRLELVCSCIMITIWLILTALLFTRPRLEFLMNVTVQCIQCILMQLIFGNGIIAIIDYIKLWRSIGSSAEESISSNSMSAKLQNEEVIELFRDYCLRHGMKSNYQLIKLWKTLSVASIEQLISYEEFKNLFIEEYIEKLRFKFPRRIRSQCDGILTQFEGHETIEFKYIQPLHDYSFQKVLEAYSSFSESTEFQNYNTMKSKLHLEFNIENHPLTTEYHALKFET
jgi:hypothetical protein